MARSFKANGRSDCEENATTATTAIRIKPRRRVGMLFLGLVTFPLTWLTKLELITAGLDSCFLISSTIDNIIILFFRLKVKVGYVIICVCLRRFLLKN